MQRLLNYAVTFVAGGTLGALISHAVTKEKMFKKMQERIDDMHAYYEDYYGHVDLPGEEKEEDEETKEVSEVINSTRSQDPIIKPIPLEEYHDYTQYYSSDPAAKEHPEDDKPVDVRPPKIIKRDECGSDPAFRYVTLSYYTGDGVLVEDGGDHYYEQDDIDAINDIVGDALDKYGFRTSDEDIICVRNYRYGADYEIAKVNGRYGDLVGKGDR